MIPRFEWTLEFALPTPVPMHQFEQSPVVVEVKDRNPNPDALVHSVSKLVERGRRRQQHIFVSREFLCPHCLLCDTQVLNLSFAVVQGPNVIGGYTDPNTGKSVSVQEHSKLVDASLKHEAAASHHH